LISGTLRSTAAADGSRFLNALKHAETVALQQRWRERDSTPLNRIVAGQRGMIRVEMAGIEPVRTVWIRREPLGCSAKSRLTE